MSHLESCCLRQLLLGLRNFAFAAVMSCAAGFWIPVLLGLGVGVAPVVTLWWMAQPGSANTAVEEAASGISVASVEVAFK